MKKEELKDLIDDFYSTETLKNKLKSNNRLITMRIGEKGASAFNKCLLVAVLYENKNIPEEEKKKLSNMILSKDEETSELGIQLYNKKWL